MKKLLPLHAMAENFGLVSNILIPKLGGKSYFIADVKVAVMFLKMYTSLSCPKLMEQLNGNIHYQMFCDVIIDPTRPLTNYKLLDDIMLTQGNYASVIEKRHNIRPKQPERDIKTEI